MPTITMRGLRQGWTTVVQTQPKITDDAYFLVGSCISVMFAGFRKYLFGIKVGPPVNSRLSVREITRKMTDTEIIAELGGENEAVISVMEMKAFLFKYRARSTHFLSYNWTVYGPFLFYLRGKDNKLIAVHTEWRMGPRGWYADAYLADNPREWSDHRQVVSRRR